MQLEPRVARRHGPVLLPITAYGLITFLTLGILYADYFVGITPASLAGVSYWYASSSFWLHYVVLYVLAVFAALSVRRLTSNAPPIGHFLVGSMGALMTIGLFVDGRVFSLFQIHINRFFIEALLQPSAIGAIGASPSAMISSLWPLAILLLPHLFIAPLSRKHVFTIGKRGIFLTVLLLTTLLAADKAVYSYYYYRGAPFVFELKNAAPVYPTPHPYHIAKVFEGVLGKSNRVTFMAQLGDRIGDGMPTSTYFDYPVVPPAPFELERPLNIIIVAAESIRADDFNADTAPFLSRLAETAISATRHYSSSNSTHLGLFSLFYGLNPHFFHDARISRIPSAPLQLLALNGYELHQTVSFSMEWYDMENFVYGDRQQTFLAEQTDVIERDRAVTDRTIALARLSAASGTPYFNFVYYYATHADYAHPPEAEVFTPALQGPINFADPRLRNNREALLNRYRNSIRFIDTEMQRMVEGLQATGVWEDTLLIFTSDHGEEFFEEGRYGHNSSLNRYQTQVPLIMHVPGMAPRRIERLTSHTDVIGTVLTLLGAPPYFLANVQGHDLFAVEEKPIYIGNAHFQRPEHYAILSGETKLEVDLRGRTLSLHSVTDLDGKPVNPPNDAELRILGLLQQFRDFGRQGHR